MNLRTELLLKQIQTNNGISRKAIWHTEYMISVREMNRGRGRGVLKLVSRHCSFVAIQKTPREKETLISDATI